MSRAPGKETARSGHRAASMTGMFAQASIGLVEVLAWWHYVVPAVAPIILGLAISDNTRKRIKKALPVITSVGVTLLTALVNSQVGAEVLLLVPLVSTAVKAAHELYGAIVSLLKRDDLSLNDILVPAKGIMDLLRSATGSQ